MNLITHCPRSFKMNNECYLYVNSQFSHWNQIKIRLIETVLLGHIERANTRENSLYCTYLWISLTGWLVCNSWIRWFLICWSSNRGVFVGADYEELLNQIFRWVVVFFLQRRWTTIITNVFPRLCRYRCSCVSVWYLSHWCCIRRFSISWAVWI